MKYSFVIILGDFIYDYDYIIHNNDGLLNLIQSNMEILDHKDCNIHSIEDFADAFNGEMFSDNMLLCFVPTEHELHKLIEERLIKDLC